MDLHTTTSEVAVYWRMLTVLNKKKRQSPCFEKVRLFGTCMCAHKLREIKYQALLFSVCNIENREEPGNEAK